MGRECLDRNPASEPPSCHHQDRPRLRPRSGSGCRKCTRRGRRSPKRDWRFAQPGKFLSDGQRGRDYPRSFRLPDLRSCHCLVHLGSCQGRARGRGLADASRHPPPDEDRALGLTCGERVPAFRSAACVDYPRRWPLCNPRLRRVAGVGGLTPPFPGTDDHGRLRRVSNRVRQARPSSICRWATCDATTADEITPARVLFARSRSHGTHRADGPYRSRDGPRFVEALDEIERPPARRKDRRVGPADKFSSVRRSVASITGASRLLVRSVAKSSASSVV